MISESGKDASEAFEDVGHSEDARSLLGPMLVGELEGGVSFFCRQVWIASTLTGSRVTLVEQDQDEQRRRDQREQHQLQQPVSVFCAQSYHKHVLNTCFVPSA